MSDQKTMSLLLVEDDDEFRETCAMWMARQGNEVTEARNGHEALHLFGQKHFDVAVLDLNMPGLTGLEVLDRLKSDEIDSEVIMLTGQATVDSAVQAMKLGACDYLSKPFPLPELEKRCRIAFERGQLRKENRQLKAVIARSRPKAQMVGDSPQMQQVYRLIERAGPTDKAILIQGESGTGKELVARALQTRSLRADRPFVTINCAALPEQLVESELFGHEKGSFTGAVGTKPGLFEVADGGTLFIDEIGEMPLGVQPKMLRVLEDGSLRRVGSHKERRVDVRIIAATNKDLSVAVEQGNFREDLYYRINVLTIELPPLVEREGDVGRLIDHFLGSEWSMDVEARQIMESCHWPGNVRQLINVLERAQILADDGVIRAQDLPREITGRTQPAVRPVPQPAPGSNQAPPAGPASGPGLASGPVSGPGLVSGPAAAGMPPASMAAGSSPVTGEPATEEASVRLEDLERAHVLRILRQHHGNKAQAARTLGIHRRKLYRLLERFNIHADEIHSRG